MKALTQHFDNNFNCFAEQESEDIVTVFSSKYEKFWKLNSNHYYIYRIYCNPLKEQPNPFNVFIGKAKDLVGYKNDKMHSQTHQGCLYDIIEIAKLPLIKNKQPIEIVKILQQYIPNITYTYNSEFVTRRMRDVIRNMISPNKNTIFHWLKTIEIQFNLHSIAYFKLTPADINENPLRTTLCDQIYDIINKELNEEITSKIVGIIFESYSITLKTLQEMIENTEKLNSIVNDIKSKL